MKSTGTGLGGLENVPIDDLVQKLRTKCCPNIINNHSTTKLWNRKTINVDNLYVDVYILNNISSENEREIDSLIEQDSQKSQDIHKGLEVAEIHNRLMILGKPGSGKTTFLKHLAIACCNGSFKPKKIPILIELRSIKDASKFNLFNKIHQEFELKEQETKEILQQGKFLILLDGLDEVPSENRKELKKQIEEFSANNSNNHFILTCRLQIPENNLKDFTDVEIADFNDEQIQTFAENWFQNKEITNKFLEKLNENERIKQLAVTPILLTLICVVFNNANNENLPPNRSQLYQRGINLLLKEWDEKRDIQRDTVSQIYRDLSIEDKQTFLYYLANSAFNQNQYPVFEETYILKYIAEYLPKLKENISIQEIQGESKNILTDIEVQHGLLIKRAQSIDSEGFYSFSHLTFQEYFTAKYIVENKQMEQLVKEHLTDNRWQEVFLLTAELMGDEAGNLLSLMQAESQHYINTRKLQNLLHWADEITSGTAGNMKPLAKRIIAIEIVFGIADAIAYANTNAYLKLIINADSYTDTNTDNTYASAIAYTKAQSNTIASAKSISFEINSAIADTYAYAIINNKHLAYTKTNAIEYAIDKVIDATDELEQLQIFNYEEFTNLAVNLSKLKGEIPKYKQPQEKFNKFIEEFQISLLDGFKIMSEMINLSNEDLEKIQEKYLYANELIIDCKKSAIGENSPLWWEEIEDRMLKPNF